MAKFVFIVPPLTGHINPTLSMGAVLLQRGHRVGWITLDKSLASRLPEGGELLHICYDQNHQQKQDTKQYLDNINKKIVYGIDSIKFLYEEVLIPLNRYSYEGIADLLDEFEPDLVITDHQMFAGAMAAVNKSIPYATTVTAPAAIMVMDKLPKVHEWEVNQIVALQQELGIDHISSIACSNLLTMVLTSRLFFGEMDLPAHYRFTGPVINFRSVNTKFDWYRLKGSSLRKILVSIGTTFDHEAKKSFFAKVIEALGNENLTVLVVSEPALFDHWPPNFIVESQVPQLELLPHLDAVVCHGGHNTVCETLLNGLPMVVIPIAYDQSHVAGRVVHTGAGQRLNFNRFKASHLKEAVYEILQNPCYRANAELLKQSFLDAGGTETAASLLEQIGMKQPLEVLKN